MAEEERNKSFWETLPGIITAIGGLFGGFGGVAALIVALNGSGGKEDRPKNDATVQAAPAKLLSAADDAAQRAAAEAIAKAKAEAEAAKARAAELERQLAETEAAKAEAAAAKARAAELEKKLAEAASSEPQQGDIKVDDVTGMKLVYVPGGCFQMGSPESEEGHHSDEKLHEVCVDGFWMGKTEVTQGQWKKVMGSNPAKFQKGDGYPVEQVSWDDAQDFIKKLNGKAGRKYRLPTEAEWEYAARAGTSTARFWGDSSDAACNYANVADQTAKKQHSEWTVHDCDDGYAETAPVGSFQPNSFGLHDMLGNAWEWCADLYDSGYYAASPQNNPLNSDIGSYRVIRGGCWGDAPKLVRGTNRSWSVPGNRDYCLGFRLLLPSQRQQGQAGR